MTFTLQEIAKTKIYLKREFKRQLHQPGRRCFYYMTKKVASAVTIDGGWSKELRMVEGVESLQAKLQLF